MDPTSDYVEHLHFKVYPELVSTGLHEQVKDFYSKEAENYDLIFGPEYGYYTGPAKTADLILQRFGTRKEIRILDVACGTGLVGLELSRRGFTNIEGIDPTQEMINQAGARKVYKTLHCAYLGTKEDPTADEAYDVACVTGGFIPNHIPAEGLEQMLKKVRKGGLVVNCMREQYLDHPFFKDSYWAVLGRILAKKSIDELTVHHLNTYFDNTPGVMYVLRAR